MIEGHSSVANSQTRDFRDCAVLIRENVSLPNAGDVPYIGLEHIGKETLSLVGHGESNSVTSAKARFRRGDILFGKLRPYFRKVVRAPFDGICSTDIWVVRAVEGVDQEFLFYCMASWPFVDFATAGAEGTRMPRAKWEHVSRYEIILPPLPEQRAIAHILGTLDDKIELNRRMNETLEEMARALFKSWFVDFEPVRAKMEGRWRRGQSLPGMPAELYDLFSDGMVSSELGEVPAGWEVKALGNLCHRPQYGYTASARDEAVGPKFLRITDINKKAWIDWNSVPYCEITEEDYRKYHLTSGDVLIARMADPGHGVLIEEDLEAVFASYLIRFRPIHWQHARLLQYWLRSDQYWELVSGRAAGTTRTSLNAKVLSRFPVIVPSIQIAATFEEKVTSLRARVVANASEALTLEAERDTLLPKLIAGEVKINSSTVS